LNPLHSLYILVTMLMIVPVASVIKYEHDEDMRVETVTDGPDPDAPEDPPTTLALLRKLSTAGKVAESDEEKLDRLENEMSDMREELSKSKAKNLALSKKLLQEAVDEVDTHVDAAEAVANSKIDEAFPTRTSCARNTYFIDWGSTGAKVVPVHIGEGKLATDVPSSLKLSSFNLKVSDLKLQGILEKLRLKLKKKSEAKAVILATAGHRIDPELAGRAWNLIRAWNHPNGGLFSQCTDVTDEGCQTIPGATEAEWELHSAWTDEQRAEAPVGHVSCGGASIQVGMSFPKVWAGGDGGDTTSTAQIEDSLKGCNLIMSTASANRTHDSKRVMKHVDGDGGTEIVFSWLADHAAGVNDEGQKTPQDYRAGGLNEMRARFDYYLKQQGINKNPCLQESIITAANLRSRHDGKCKDSFGLDVDCVIGAYDAFLTSLQGTPDAEATKKACADATRRFVHRDRMLQKWRAQTHDWDSSSEDNDEPDCLDLLRSVPSWKFLTSFSRKGQFGAELPTEGEEAAKPFSDILHDYLAFDDPDRPADCEAKMISEKDVGHLGSFLSQALLMEFLRALGMTRSQGFFNVYKSDAEWSQGAMAHFKMKQGWLEGDSTATDGCKA